MDNKKRNIFVAVLFLVLGVFVVGTYASTPTQTVQKEECTDCDEGQATIIEGVLTQIDAQAAKSVTLQVEELNSKECADEIATKLNSLGNIGKIRCDLTAKRFEVEYDATKLTEEIIIEAFLATDHPATPVAGS